MYLRSRLNLMACSVVEISTTAILLFHLFTVAEKLRVVGLLTRRLS